MGKQKQLKGVPQEVKNDLINDYEEWTENSFHFQNHKVGLMNQIKKHLNKGKYDCFKARNGIRRIVKTFSKQYLVEKAVKDERFKNGELWIKDFDGEERKIMFFESKMIEEVCFRLYHRYIEEGDLPDPLEVQNDNLFA